MWQDLSRNTFASSCLQRLDDCFQYEASHTSKLLQISEPSSLNNEPQIQTPLSVPVPLLTNTDTNHFQTNLEQEKLHNSYRNFLNMDRAMPWMSSIEAFPFSNNVLNNNTNINDNSNNSNFNDNNNVDSRNFKSLRQMNYIEQKNVFTRQGQIVNSHVFNSSPVKSDTSTATPPSIRSIINDNLFNYRDEKKMNFQTYFSSNNGLNNMESYRFGEVPPLSFNCDDKEKNEAYYIQANNLLKILSPSWILCIDIAAILLTNTDNKMALSNIGPKLSCFARDALRQIKQKKLSRFIKEHNNFFDIRRPSPNHSALYVTLKFPLPNIVQQFLPSIVQLRKYEIERTQFNSQFQDLENLSNSELEINQSSPKEFNDVQEQNTDGSLSKKSQNDLNSSQNVHKKINEDKYQIYDDIPAFVKNYQSYECWLCVREFANVLIHQPGYIMELREIGVLMSQKAKIQAKRNSSKKNYKSFLLSYPKLFRIFGKDDNHSIQWIGTSQDFVKLNSIKYQPSQTDDELFNVPTLNQSHSQFLFNLNNCSVSLP